MTALAAVPAGAAEPIPSGGLPDLVGPRTLALSAGVGLATGGDGLFLNPAALAARTRYAIEALGYLDRRGAENATALFGGSVVDSKSAPVTAGLAYVRAHEGDVTGNAWTLALAGAAAERLYLGVAGKYLELKGAEEVGAATLDAGLFWQVTSVLSLGAAGYNLVPIGHERVAPMGVGAGLTVGTEESFQVTADWRADLDRADGTRNRYGVGAELLLFQIMPLRGGYQVDEVLDTHWWSAGLGLVSRTGVALDVGYRQSVDDANARTLAASLRLFLDL